MRGGPSLKGKGGLVGFRKNPQSESSDRGSEPEISLSEPENPGSERGEHRIRSHESCIRSHERQNRTAGGAAQQRAEESPLHHQREAEGESQFIFVLNEAGVGSNGDSLFLHHPPPMGVVASRLAVPQVGHHVAHVAGREGGTEHRVAGDVFENLGTRHELQVGGVDVGVGVGDTVVFLDQLLHVVVHDEEAVVHLQVTDVLRREPVHPRLLLAIGCGRERFLLHHLLSQRQGLGIEMAVVDGCLARTLNAFHLPYEVATRLLFADDVDVVARAAERGVVEQLRAVAGVGTSQGDGGLGDDALEGAEVLAHGCLKLVETDESLAGTQLQEVLVVVVGGGVVGVILAQLGRQQVLKEGGLVESALAHEDEHHLVDHPRGYPARHHAYDPLAEHLGELLLGVEVGGVILHYHAPAQLTDVVGVALLPFWQALEKFGQWIVSSHEVAVQHDVQQVDGDLQSVEIHPREDGVFDGVVDDGPAEVAGVLDVESSHLGLVGDGVSAQLESGAEPLPHVLDVGGALVSFAGGIEVPAAEVGGVLVHPVYDALIQIKSETRHELSFFPNSFDDYVPKDSKVRMVDRIVRSMDINPLMDTYAGIAPPPYSPKMLLSLVVFAYINGIYSCRGIADALKYDVRYMWICGGKRLSFATINRFRTNHMIKCIDFYFDAVVSILVEKGVISLEEQYVDGTKIESKANKYTFVWKKTVEKNRAKLLEKTSAALDQIK